jgi:hypothetical protein
VTPIGRRRIHTDQAARQRAYRERAKKRAETRASEAAPEITVLRAPFGVVGSRGQLLLSVVERNGDARLTVYDPSGVPTVEIIAAAEYSYVAFLDADGKVSAIVEGNTEGGVVELRNRRTGQVRQMNPEGSTKL